MLIQQRRGEDDHLNDLINDYLKGKQDLIGIQIGSYRGQSTQMFLKSGAFKKLYCIDPWLPDYDPNDEAATKEIVLAEQDFDRRFNGNEIIRKIKAKSTDVVNLFDNESIDFIYIDGCHTYEAVKEDLNNYYPKVKNGGIVAGHDWHKNWLGVVKAVSQYFGKSPRKIYLDTSWVYIKLNYYNKILI